MDPSGDRMFCHACGGVWLRRSEDSLVCPRCDSEFTEIVSIQNPLQLSINWDRLERCLTDNVQIEIPPDTDPEPPGLNTPPSPPRPAGLHSPFNPFVGHNPWAHGEPEEHDDDDHDPFGFGSGPGFAHRAYRSPDGRFTFSSTTFGGRGGRGFGGPPRPSPGMGEFGGDPLVPMVNRLNTIFGGLADTYREQGRPSEAGHHDVPDPDERAPDEPHDFGPTGRLFPRDADGPQPMAPPLGTLGEYVTHFAPIKASR